MNSFPKSDLWRLTERDPDSQNFGRDGIFDFSFFCSEEIKLVVKEYIWTHYITGNRIPTGLKSDMQCFKHFDAFCRHSKLASLCDLNNSIADDYRSFLRLRISPAMGKPLSYAYQSRCFSTLTVLVGWCRIFLPDAVPAKQIFTGNEYSKVHSNLRIEYIPDDMLLLINNALKDEDNLHLKYGIIILECTGMRIGDLLLLKTDCLSEHAISGHTISWFDHKCRKARNNVPIPPECKAAVEMLLKIMEPIRDRAAETDKNLLFLWVSKYARKNKPVVAVARQTFERWCRCFCEKHDIRDEGGNIYRITSHMFRRTIATDMLSKGINLKVIQELLGHVSPATTKKYYADVKDSNRAEMFLQIGILGNIHEIGQEQIPETRDLQWFQSNQSGKARLSDGYCTLPIDNGKPCGRLLSQQKCYLCNRYITTLEDLGTHRQHLAELQSMLNDNIYGEHYAAHLIPTTLALKEIIRRLEELQNGQ